MILQDVHVQQVALLDAIAKTNWTNSLKMWSNEVELTHQREPLQGCYSQQTRTLEAVYRLEGNNPSISPSFCGVHQ